MQIQAGKVGTDPKSVPIITHLTIRALKTVQVTAGKKSVPVIKTRFDVRKRIFLFQLAVGGIKCTGKWVTGWSVIIGTDLGPVPTFPAQNLPVTEESVIF